MAQPGVMLYFDILEPIKVLPDEDKGRLLVAILEYGNFGTVPEFTGMLAMAWGFVRPKIDRDRAEYNRSVLRRQYATACRERKKKGEPDITFDEWLKTLDIDGNQMVSLDINDNQWYPTTTATASTSTIPSTSTTTKTTPLSTAAAAVTTATGADAQAAATAANKLKFMNGELGKGVVALTDDQIEELLELMGIDMFDHYVKRLSSYIIRKNASITDHYHTIINWWKKDSTC